MQARQRRFSQMGRVTGQSMNEMRPRVIANLSTVVSALPNPLPAGQKTAKKEGIFGMPPPANTSPGREDVR
jgi:hypothetical protein